MSVVRVIDQDCIALLRLVKDEQFLTLGILDFLFEIYFRTGHSVLRLDATIKKKVRWKTLQIQKI